MKHNMGGADKRRRQAALRERDGDLCCHCGGVMDFTPRGPAPIRDDAATMEHIVPRSQGGSNAMENLALAHSYCNNVRGNGDPRNIPHKVRHNAAPVWLAA